MVTNKNYVHLSGSLLIALYCLLSLFIQPVHADQTVTMMTDLVTATDKLGRTLPGAESVPELRKERYVGIFYFLWLGEHGEFFHTDPGTPEATPKPGDEYPPAPYDIRKILAVNSESPEWGPVHAFHHWSEPHLGYYFSSEEFVMVRHTQMLGDIGIDVLFLDASNGCTYPENYLKLCNALETLRAKGRPVPQIAFLAYNSAPIAVESLWEDFYSKKLHQECWFYWAGKPLLLAPPDSVPEEAKDFFTVRESWAWSNPNSWFEDGHQKWIWLDHSPQAYGWDDNPSTPTMMPVAVAEHPIWNIGRSHHNGSQPPPEDIQPDKGLYFAEQWEHALETDPELIFVTGWNEWVAMRFLSEGKLSLAGKRLSKGETYFVDLYTQEFSRDIEPMKGGHEDSYYYQLASYIRRFKGIQHAQPASAPVNIVTDGSAKEWSSVTPVYLDDPSDTQSRNHRGWGHDNLYTNNAPRNNIIQCQVARNDHSVFFLLQTQTPITPRQDQQWMRLYIDLDENPSTGWFGYDRLVNRTKTGEGLVSVEKFANGSWKLLGEAKYAHSEKSIELAIPRTLLNQEKPTSFHFKWTDSMPNSNNILDWIDNGDAAPPGRFNYIYHTDE